MTVNRPCNPEIRLCLSPGLKKLSGVFKKGLHLGKSSPSSGTRSPAAMERASSEPHESLPEVDGEFRRRSSGVRFSVDEPRVIGD
jgi:hypothetical protein